MKVDATSLASLAHGSASDVEQAAQDDDAARKFEAMIAKMMVKELRRSLPEGSLFGSREMEMFADFFDQAFAEQMAGGDGLGLRGGIERSLGSSTDQLPVRGVKTSDFGHRHDPFGGGERMHKGIDIAAKRGAAVRPVRGGRVVKAAESESYGNYVVVDHGGGLTTLYAHCHELRVAEGDFVGTGDVIATVGSTGRSTGDHLHLEARQDGEARDPAIVFGWGDR